jgi:PGF-pre-PGF domain-containing protein
MLIFGVMAQVQPASADTSMTTEEFKAQIRAKVDFYSYPRLSQVNGWARDTYFMQYYNKNTKHVIYLYLNEDFSVREVEFRQYASSAEKVPLAVANDALAKLRYTSVIDVPTETEQISNGVVVFSKPEINKTIQKIRLDTTEAAGNVTSTIIEDRTDLASGIILDIDVPGNLIDTTGTVTFQVPTAWINRAGIKREEVVLYHEFKGRWKELPTKYNVTVEEYAQYEADTVPLGKSIMIYPAFPIETEAIDQNGTVIFQNLMVKNMIPMIEFNHYNNTSTSGNVTVEVSVGPEEEVSYIITTIEVPEELKDSDGAITFQVPKKWLKQNGIKKGDIRLYREFNECWEELQPEYVGSVGGYEQYKILTTNFSVFMISGKSKSDNAFIYVISISVILSELSILVYLWRRRLISK